MPFPRKDWSGRIFSFLTVVSPGRIENGSYYWICSCVCGKMTEVQQSNLRTGRIKSCGCKREELLSIAGTTHGHTRQDHGRRTRTWITWQSMKARCYNPDEPHYGIYGGRGVKICKEWLESFESFLRDMGERPNGKTIDRIDTNGNYEPGNCRWATSFEQAQNRRDTIWIEFEGERKTLLGWAAKVRLPAHLIGWRIKKGWSARAALFTPVRPKRPSVKELQKRQMTEEFNRR